MKNNNLKNILNLNGNLQNAIEIISSDNLSASYRVVLLVDDNNKFRGTITDGDIRRALLRKVDLNVPLENIMNKNPVFLPVGSDKKIILQTMLKNSIQHIPLINNNDEVKELFSIDELRKNNFSENKVLIMAGGFGKRLLPLTETIPKPMLKIGGKPILELIIKNLFNQMLINLFISTHYKSKIIKDYFKDGERFGVNINYLTEKKPLGTGGSLSLLPDLKKPLIVVNGDIISHVDYLQMLSFHEENNADVSVAVSNYSINVPFGVIENDNFLIRSIIEKPTYNYFINAGIYIINPQHINKLETNTPFDITEFIQDLIRQKLKVVLYPIHELWSDIGRVEDYNRAQETFKK